jgi:hypothetical protein
MIQSALKLIQQWWRVLRHRRRIDRVVLVASRRELPAELGNALYLVGANPVQWAVLDCPCGCGERANTKIGVASRTSWSLTLTEGKASLSPSLLMPVDRCGSHFFIRENRIVWVLPRQNNWSIASSKPREGDDRFVAMSQNATAPATPLL